MDFRAKHGIIINNVGGEMKWNLWKGRIKIGTRLGKILLMSSLLSALFSSDIVDPHIL